jgi:hypothetical protein
MTDDTEIATQRFSPLVPKPFSPRTIREGDIVPPPPDERIAHAMEYIADHMGRLDRKLDKIIERLSERESLGRDQK